MIHLILTPTPTENIRTEEAITESARPVALREGDVDPSKEVSRGQVCMEEVRTEEVRTEEVQGPTVVILTTVGNTTIVMSPLTCSPVPVVKAGSTF